MEDKIREIDRKFDKIEFSMEKLTSIQSDISKILATQEQRITSMEKRLERIDDDNISNRKDMEVRLEKILDKMEKDIKHIREINETNTSMLSTKLASLEKFTWVLIGAGAVFGWLTNVAISLVPKILN